MGGGAGKGGSPTQWAGEHGWRRLLLHGDVRVEEVADTTERSETTRVRGDARPGDVVVDGGRDDRMNQRHDEALVDHDLFSLLVELHTVVPHRRLVGGGDEIVIGLHVVAVTATIVEQ